MSSPEWIGFAVSRSHCLKWPLSSSTELVSCLVLGKPKREGRDLIVGAEVSGLRSMVQGATTGHACVECWAVFNQGMQAPGFLFFFLPFFLGQEKGMQAWICRLALGAWLWLIEKARESERLIFPSSVRYPSFIRKKWPREGNFSSSFVRSCIAWLKCFIYLWISVSFWLLINNVVLFINVELVEFLSLKSLPLVTLEKHITILPILWSFFLFTFLGGLSEIHGSLGWLGQTNKLEKGDIVWISFILWSNMHKRVKPVGAEKEKTINTNLYKCLLLWKIANLVLSKCILSLL